MYITLTNVLPSNYLFLLFTKSMYPWTLRSPQDTRLPKRGIKFFTKLFVLTSSCSTFVHVLDKGLQSLSDINKILWGILFLGKFRSRLDVISYIMVQQTVSGGQ